MDGWIEWAGGPCPDEIELMRKEPVEVKLRDGSTGLQYPLACGWIHHGWPDDVLAYREPAA